MSEESAFFIARSGAIWACFLDGRPAVKLGGEQEFWQTVTSFYAERHPAQKTGPVAPSPYPPPPASPGRADEGDPGRANQRSAPRHVVSIVGRVFTSGGSREAVIADLSASGCRLDDYSGRSIEEGSHLTVRIGTIGPIPGTVRWTRSSTVGVLFDAPLHPSVLEHIRLQFGRAK